MKIKSGNLCFKTTVLCLGLVASVLTTKVHADAIDLILTEVDDDTLVATGTDGANWTIVGSGNSWTGTRNTPFDGMNPFNYQSASWTEPDAPAYLNFLEMFYYNTAIVDTEIAQAFPAAAAQFQFHVTSDQLATLSDSPVADGTIVTLYFGVYSEVEKPYTVQYFDHVSRTVPDHSSTILCLGFGLLSLVWFRRFYAQQ